VADYLPAIVVAVVGLVLLGLLGLLVASPVRRFTRAQARLAAEVHTEVTRLRAIASVRGNRDPAA
jgi:type II secretory pathway pseudopilin PulG